MIIFSGNLSKDCKKHIAKRIKFMSFVGITISAIIMLILFIFLTIYVDILFILFDFVFLFIPLLSFIPPDQKSINKLTPNKVSIINNQVISESASFYYQTKISNVNKIVDYGDWYQIFFKYPYKNQTYICQKDLIEEGTIEDFENLFKEKIVRKIKK